MIEKVESAPHYRDLHEVFSKHRRQSTFGRLHDPTEDEKDERQSVIDYLNHYELVAIGIRERILDAKFYRNWMESAFVRDWNAAADFIQYERWRWSTVEEKWTYHRQIFGNYQVMANEWSSQAVNLTEATSGPPDAPSGPGDDALPEPDGRSSGDGNPTPPATRAD